MLRRILFSNVKNTAKRGLSKCTWHLGRRWGASRKAGKGARSGPLWALGRMRSVAGRVLTCPPALGPLSCHPASLRSLPHTS